MVATDPPALIHLVRRRSYEGTSVGGLPFVPEQFPATGPTVQWRRLTAGVRMLPQVLVIGAMRAGTTSLFSWLCSHPDVRPGLVKEPHYFSVNYQRGLAWYRSLFPIRWPGRITVEASPSTMLHPLAPARVRAVVPNARLVVLLRDPVERALSHYWTYRKMGMETDSLGAALERERLSVEVEWKRLNRGEASFALAYSYLAGGEYASHLRRWFDVFDRSQLMIIESERLFAEPTLNFAALLDWLGLPTLRYPLSPMNAFPRGEADEDVIAALRAHYEPHNEALFALLGHRLWGR